MKLKFKLLLCLVVGIATLNGIGSLALELQAGSRNPSAESPKKTENTPIHIVLDLDETLVYPDEFEKRILDLKSIDIDLTFNISSEQCSQTFRHQYAFAHGAIEFIAALSKLSNVKLSFFSAGGEQRNQPLTSEILKRVSKYTGFTPQVGLYSQHHLSREDSFQGRKDLRVLGPDVNLENVILVDDRPDYVARRPNEESFNGLPSHRPQ